MLIITANKNQSYRLRQSPSFCHANILSLQEVAEQLQQDHAVKLLHPIEQDFIWQHCISASLIEKSAALEPLAKMAADAWWLMHHWQMDPDEWQLSHNANTTWFYAVAKKFLHYCAKHRSRDEAALLTHATIFLETHPKQAIALLTHAVKKNFFYGFLKLTPLQKRFFEALKKAGVSVNPLMRPEPASCQPPVLHTFHEAKDELKAAITWACAEHKKNPAKKIALIIPELSLNRQHIESSMLREGCTSFVILSPAHLSDYGLVQTALMLLRLSITKSVDLNTIISLLRSPYWGETFSDKKERATFAHQLRTLQIETLTWEAILHLAEPWPVLQKLLFTLQESHTRIQQNLREWSVHWKTLFQAMGFPNTTLLTAEETSLQQQLDTVWNEWSQLLPWQHRYSAQEALDLLNLLCKKTQWHFEEKKEEDKNAPCIMISNLLDALDLNIDQAWLMNATQGVIPFKYSINHLLDKKIQNKYRVWAVDQAMQDDLALIYYRQLQQVVPQLIVSFAKEEAGQIKNPALLCASLTATPYLTEALSSTVPQDFYDNCAITHWHESIIPGGSAALKSQRLCPMQAFATYRLDLKKLPKTILGFTPAERGIVVHRALQLIWQQLQSQKNLLQLSEESKQRLITRTLAEALKTVSWLRRKLLPKTLLDLESTYLTTLLSDWLTRESTRAPFKIFALEQATEVIFAEHTFRLRMDRIDQLEDGRFLLIDYKTGPASSNAWQLDLFTEPQLPLYCVTSALPIDGIAFAELSTQKLRMTGLSRTEMALGACGSLKTVADWDQLKLDWQKKLSELVTAFVASTAQLEPFSGNITCQQCTLHSFCRVFE